MASKTKIFVCSECGFESSGFLGKCPSCNNWGTLKEFTVGKSATTKSQITNTPKKISEVNILDLQRVKSGMVEFDNVLGGGFVPSEILLLSGEPGIGKSTLLLHLAYNISQMGEDVLYASGEENPSQIKSRAERIGISESNFLLVHEIDTDKILDFCIENKIKFLIIDSIQTLHSGDNTQASPSALKDNVMKLVQFAKQHGVVVVLVGHITKDGAIAGPKLVEHMVDCTLFFEGDDASGFRLLRSLKNRYGPSGEVGVFQMQTEGLIEVSDPASVLLDANSKTNRVLSPVIDGNRCFMIEVQSLVTPSNYSYPSRVSGGFPNAKLLTLVAILKNSVGIDLSNHDVYLEITSKVRIDDPSLSLGVIVSLLLSYFKKEIGDVVAFGDVSLKGEIRSDRYIQSRMKEVLRTPHKCEFHPESVRHLKEVAKALKGSKVEG